MPQSSAENPIRDHRLQRGWTLVELAQKCTEAGAPVDNGSLSRIERGVHVPRPKLRAVLTELLELEPAAFEKAS